MVIEIIRAVLAVIQALAPVAALAMIGLYGKRQQQTGAALEAGKVDETTAKAEAAMAQAEAAAPSTQLAVVDRLNNGTF